MTRTAAPITPPTVLTIAGSDSGGGAGIQADLKTIEAQGSFGTSAITAVTSQNTQGVDDVHVLPPEHVRSQCEAVLQDFDVDAIKTGMLATAGLVELVTDVVGGESIPSVVDPVMVAASGDRLLDESAEAAYQDLVRSATLVTPNADEAAVLTGIEVSDAERAADAGEALLEMGVEAALVKGGHVPGADVVDVLVTEESVEHIRHPRVDTEATHGSGCTLSAAIATALGQDESLTDAVHAGIELLSRAVRHPLDVGQGPGAVHHTVAARNRQAQRETADAVRAIVSQVVEQDLGHLVPEVGTNVVGATPYAEHPAECAAVDGRLTRRLDGLSPGREVRFGASTHVARLLLVARETDPRLQFALNCRHDAAIGQALESLAWQTATVGGSNEQADGTSGDQSIERLAERAFDGVDTLDAVVVRGGHEWEPMTFLLSRDSLLLADHAIDLADELDDTGG